MTRDWALRLLVQQLGVPEVLRRLGEVCIDIAGEQKDAGLRERWEVSASVLQAGGERFDSLMNGRASQAREQQFVPGEPQGMVI